MLSEVVGWRAEVNRLAGSWLAASSHSLCLKVLAFLLKWPIPSSKPGSLHCLLLTLQLSLTCLSSAAGESSLLFSTHVIKSGPFVKSPYFMVTCTI